MYTPHIETDRLLVRPYTSVDLKARHRLHRECFGTNESPDATRHWLEWTLAAYRELARLYQPPYADYAIVLKTTRAVIGGVGLVPSVVPWATLETDPSEGRPRDEFISPEFGLFWAVLPEYQRKGYATEAAAVFVRWIFEMLMPRRIVASTEYENRASRRVMENLGMRVYENPFRQPPWFQVLGVLDNPAAHRVASP